MQSGIDPNVASSIRPSSSFFVGGSDPRNVRIPYTTHSCGWLADRERSGECARQYSSFAGKTIASSCYEGDMQYLTQAGR